MDTYALDSTWRLLLKDLGVPADRVLRRAGLPEDLLARTGVRLEASAFYRFWAGLEAELADPLMPIRLCRVLRSEGFSPALFAALCSPNLLVAVQRIAAYKKLVAPMRLQLQESENSFSIELLWTHDGLSPPDSLVVAELLFFATLARIGTREPLVPLQVMTTRPPAQGEAYRQFLGTPIVDGQAHRLVFSRADALRPFLTANNDLWSAFEPELRTRLAELQAQVPVGQRVRAVLLEALPSGQTDMDRVAARLAMSRRSLQRHLEAEGHSYQQLLRETRLSLAQHYLSRTELPTAEISFLLGFDEPNSFYRAFRQWTGHTPEGSRRRSRAQPAVAGRSAMAPSR